MLRHTKVAPFPGGAEFLTPELGGACVLFGNWEWYGISAARGPREAKA